MIVSTQDLKINTVSESGNKGVFTFEPLPASFGHTLGNSYRRVLETSLKGAAVTQIKIKGATHQFTTVEGVKEDVVEMTLNFKQLRFKLHSDKPVVVTISKKGEGVVTGADIECTSDVEVVNKDRHIATLSDSKASFEVELTVEPGVGYSSSEEREASKVGVITLDAMYSPVMRAVYSVEPTRHGNITGLDKLILEVETDGSISAKAAVIEASKLLADYYNTIALWPLNTVKADITEINAAAATTETTHDEVVVDELRLPTRTINALKKQGITNLGELGSMNDEELADIKNLGEKSLVEIKELLQKEGYR